MMIETVLCDLDGVVWLAHRPIAGSAEAIAAMRDAGCRVMFVTNNSSPTVADQEAALAAVGVPAKGDVVTSAMAAALLVEPGERVLVSGGAGIVEALQRRSIEVVRNEGEPVEGTIDAVMVGLHRDFDYHRLAVAARAVHGGARLIGTNSDPTYPTPTGLDPGGGSILAAIATAAGVEPEVAGKPYPAMARCVQTAIASDHRAAGRPFDPQRVLMVGDRVDTDGGFAKELGCRFALVRSGSTPDDDAVDLVDGSLDLADLAAVARRVVARGAK
jgi:glycerol 3-phosphatase-2